MTELEILREEDYGSTPKGLIYCTRLMKRWLHGKDPCDSLRMIETFEELVSKQDRFRKMVELQELLIKYQQK